MLVLCTFYIQPMGHNRKQAMNYEETIVVSLNLSSSWQSIRPSYLKNTHVLNIWYQIESSDPPPSAGSSSTSDPPSAESSSTTDPPSVVSKKKDTDPDRHVAYLIHRAAPPQQRHQPPPHPHHHSHRAAAPSPPSAAAAIIDLDPPQHTAAATRCLNGFP